MADLVITNEGPVFIFQPLTDKAREWLEEAVESDPYQWLGNSLAVEHRYAALLAEEAQKDGLTIS